MPLATAMAATAMEHSAHGNANPRTALPFVVEHTGGINKEGAQFFRMRSGGSGCSGQQASAECKGERPALLVQQGALWLKPPAPLSK